MICQKSGSHLRMAWERGHLCPLGVREHAHATFKIMDIEF
jgi:hypothetical protein